VLTTEMARRAQRDKVRLVVILFVAVEVVDVKRLHTVATATAAGAAIPVRITVAPEERST
jgi:hypothetical protein